MNRDEWIEAADAVLAPQAMRNRDTRGRRHPEPEHPWRLPFERDRDRIIHSTAFRRLEYKTQVFVNHEGDYYRTRLTHTMEAAQIARTCARALRLNQDLAEAIALSHDLGHTPFGHAGERILNQEMEPYGGFEHNAQTLRIVDQLEERYPGFPGLNLTWEVREGIAKHSPPYDRGIPEEFEPGRAPCLEAQLVDCADEIAYNSHDIDDGIQSGLITAEQLARVTLWREMFAQVTAAHPQASFTIQRYQVQRALIELFVTDLVDATRARIAEHHLDTIEAVRAHGRPIATFSTELQEKRLELKEFLMRNLYRHFRVVRMTSKAQRVVRDLFRLFLADPGQLPPHVAARAADEKARPRVIADYIAGMTDRFAVEEYGKLFDPESRV